MGADGLSSSPTIAPPELPKLRGDLQLSPQPSGDGISAVVKDPVTSRFFRLGHIEYFVAQQLDGATSLDTLQRTVRERINRPLDADAINKLVGQFRRLGLLEETRPVDSRRHSGPFRGNPLYLRLKAFDPDRLLDALVPYVGAFFTRTFLIGSAIAILVALAVTVTNWPEITRGFGTLYRFDALFLAWLTLLTVTTAHEFAHGLTCKRFGGHVHEMGFLLLYFQPAFYCNVSDAWLMPEKSRRLWVTFAGAYLEITVWALATLTWRVTNPDTWLSFVALVVMATSAIKTLFNLNPLIKLDGYYLLSDYLEIPNLRQKSLRYVKALARNLCTSGETSLWRTRGRNERIYFRYGILAIAYSGWLMAVVVSRLGSFLVGRYQGAGFVVFTGFLMMAFQRPLGTVWSKVTRAVKGRAGLVGLVALLGVISILPAELKVSGDFRILPGHNTDVRAQVEGIISEVYKDEGDVVAKGDLIVSLADRDFEADLRKVGAEIEEKEARLQLLKAGPRHEEVEVTRADVVATRLRREHGEKMYEDASHFRAAELAKIQSSVEKAEQRLVFARNDLQRVTALFKATLVPRKSVDEAEQEVMIRQKEVEEAQASAKMVLSDDVSEARKERDLATQDLERAEGKLKMLLAGSRPEEIRATQAELSRLQAQRGYLQQQLQLVHIVSPAAGVVTTPQLKEKLGQRVSRGDLIAKVYEQSTVTAEILVPEKEIADVRVGQTVVFKARAFPDRSFSSRVTAIAPIAMEDTAGFGGRALRVTTEIDNRSGLLKSEMTGNAKIYCGSRRVFELMTRRVFRYIRVEFWSWW